ncbi:hypothetical protein KUM37_18160 [Streptomonospora sp. NEAU-YY374]|uniref:hypothetical protein n=1 Tax=Streptomonospora nanhaiensis TaxID=1323731 RepID=UPI0015CDC313|nr:hypothetical protein [Streptomonospora nanhaiensis]MBV2365241.1 hypothetical protein [Streptomonospora nanhaiensis]MBX9390244.1 hypothetical protein [Streptomonospora nanhaiensis]
MTLPGADELFFRSSEPTGPEPAPSAPEPPAARSAGASGTTRPVPRARPARPPRPSGRQRHDEKITVYISAPELLALEQTRLTLRGDHGLTADRGRIVREAVAVLLADFEEHGASSMLVRRLSET